MEIFGELERFLSEDLYPYRWPLSIVAVVVAAAVAWFAWRAGWVARLVAAARARPLVAGVVIVVGLAVTLPTFYYLASPLWVRTTLVEESPLTTAASLQSATAAATTPATQTAPPGSGTPSTVAGDAAAFPRAVVEGTWEGADDFHFAEGHVLVIETEPGVYLLRVEEFSIRNGPDLFVYLSADPAGYTEDAVKLGALKATDGAFNYEIPSGLGPADFRSAVVWCDAFAVLFATAVLE